MAAQIAVVSLLLCPLLKGAASAWLPAGVLHPALTSLGWSGAVEPGHHLPALMDMERGVDGCLRCWLCGVVQTEGDLQVCVAVLPLCQRGVLSE